MERYDYREAMREDVKQYIEDEINLKDWIGNREDLEEKLSEELWTVDSVTGNGSGSYTFSTWEAEENICHNLDLLEEACNEFGGDLGETLAKGAEACDVTIRCYLLGEIISEVLDEMEKQRRL